MMVSDKSQRNCQHKHCINITAFKEPSHDPSQQPTSTDQCQTSIWNVQHRRTDASPDPPVRIAGRAKKTIQRSSGKVIESCHRHDHRHHRPGPANHLRLGLGQATGFRVSSFRRQSFRTPHSALRTPNSEFRIGFTFFAACTCNNPAGTHPNSPACHRSLFSRCLRFAPAPIAGSWKRNQDESPRLRREPC